MIEIAIHIHAAFTLKAMLTKAGISIEDLMPKDLPVPKKKPKPRSRRVS